jgi:iron complex outermembrane receptor protein
VFNPTYGNLGDPTGTAPPRFFESGLANVGLFAQDLVSFGPFKLLASFRYDTVEQDSTTIAAPGAAAVRTANDDSAVTPRTGLIWQPTSTLSLYASYAQSFRPVVGATFAGQAFDPERGEQVEIGAKVDFLDGRLGVTAALFDITRENLTTADPANPGFSIQVGEQQSRGFELEASGQITPALRLIGSYAYVRAEITEDNSGNRGKTPANVARHSARLWLVHEFQGGPLHGLGFGAGALYIDDRWANSANTAILPAYWRVDALAYYPITENIRAQLNILNLLDEEYFETSTFSSVANGITPGAPLTVIGRVGFRF